MSQDTDNTAASCDHDFTKIRYCPALGQFNLYCRKECYVGGWLSCKTADFKDMYNPIYVTIDGTKRDAWTAARLLKGKPARLTDGDRSPVFYESPSLAYVSVLASHETQAPHLKQTCVMDSLQLLGFRPSKQVFDVRNVAKAVAGFQKVSKWDVDWAFNTSTSQLYVDFIPRLCRFSMLGESYVLQVNVNGSHSRHAIAVKGGEWVGDAASGIGLLPLHIDSFSKLGITEVLSAYRKK